MRILVLLFIFLSGCSVYKSQGRRDFETEVPARVPISVVFHCRDMNVGQSAYHTVDLQSLKESYPKMIIREQITEKTVVLLASQEGSSTVCISEGLDFLDYDKNLSL